MITYIHDDGLKQSLNSRRTNYWDTYLAEIFELLGLRPARLSLAQLENTGALDSVRTLIIGQQSGEVLSPSSRETISSWVERGGTLIGFSVEGLDEVFGIETLQPPPGTKPDYAPLVKILQGADDWAINGYFSLRSHVLTREVHHMLWLEQKLPIVSDIRVARLKSAIELAVLHEVSGKLLCLPVITWNTFGAGRAGWFAFDVAKTVWLLHQGRPAPDHPENGKYARAQDMSILGANTRLVPYADELCWLLQNMIASQPHPFIYQVPPQAGQVADALLYYGGDEYHGPTSLSIKAAEFMKELGLPYQTNIESDVHPMTREEHQLIRSLGTEVSAYYHLYEEDGFTMKEDHYLRQSDRFFERFGYRPVATVNHCIRWKGWTEPAKWMLKAGTRADNGFSNKCVSNDNHFRNSASFGFGFGTSFPFYFWDDWRGDNARIDFMEQPIVGYEFGHRTSTSVNRDPDTRAPEDLHLAIGLALKYHCVMNLFYHPANLANSPTCRDALREIVRYIEYRQARVVHMNNRMVAEWWDARHASTVRNEIISANSIRFASDCRYDGGMVVKVPLAGTVNATAHCDGAAATTRCVREFGRDWLYVVVPKGKHDIAVQWSKA